MRNGSRLDHRTHSTGSRTGRLRMISSTVGSGFKCFHVSSQSVRLAVNAPKIKHGCRTGQSSQYMTSGLIGSVDAAWVAKVPDGLRAVFSQALLSAMKGARNPTPFTRLRPSGNDHVSRFSSFLDSTVARAVMPSRLKME